MTGVVRSMSEPDRRIRATDSFVAELRRMGATEDVIAAAEGRGLVVQLRPWPRSGRDISPYAATENLPSRAATDTATRGERS